MAWNRGRRLRCDIQNITNNGGFFNFSSHTSNLLRFSFYYISRRQKSTKKRAAHFCTSERNAMNRFKTIARAVQRELAGAQIPALPPMQPSFCFSPSSPALLFLLSVTQYTTVSMDGILNFSLPHRARRPGAAGDGDLIRPLPLQLRRDPLSSTVSSSGRRRRGVYGLVRGLNQALRVQGDPGRICSSGPCACSIPPPCWRFCSSPSCSIPSARSFLSKILLPGSVFVPAALDAPALPLVRRRGSCCWSPSAPAISSFLPAQHTAPGAAGEPSRQLRLGHLLRAVFPLCKALRRVVHLRQHLHRRLHHALALFLYVYLLLRRNLKSIRACVKKNS